jgi:hypothetical protein
MAKVENKFIHKLSSGYHFTALTLVNMLVALFVLNIILFAIFSASDHFRRDPVSAEFGHSTVNSAYPGLSESEINALLKETWSRPYIYEPYTQFKERQYQGYYVNVDTNGFRATKNQGTWPPQREKLNIFLFGGSTMFGYGVADDQTVASYLQESLMTKLNQDVRVYNFGRGDYYSTQERILYENILVSGVIPDVAIFVDGLNDFYYNTNEPLFTGRFREFVDKGKGSTSVTDFISKTSLGRAARGLRYRFTNLFQEDLHSERQNEKKDVDLNTTRKYADPKTFDAVIQRYLQNKKLIEAASESFDVTPIFVWQPVPTYHYDQHYHLFSEGGYGKHSYSQYGYERIAELLQETPLGDNFLWCADIQKNKTVPLYIDTVHYSDSFSKELAIEIADLIINRSLIVGTDQMTK